MRAVVWGCSLLCGFWVCGCYPDFFRMTFRKVSWGTVTLPVAPIFCFPFFCFSRSFIFRVMSPPYSFAVTSFLSACRVLDAMILPSARACIFTVKSVRGMVSWSMPTMSRASRSLRERDTTLENAGNISSARRMSSRMTSAGLFAVFLYDNEAYPELTLFRRSKNWRISSRRGISALMMQRSFLKSFTSLTYPSYSEKSWETVETKRAGAMIETATQGSVTDCISFLSGNFAGVATMCAFPFLSVTVKSVLGEVMMRSRLASRRMRSVIISR